MTAIKLPKAIREIPNTKQRMNTKNMSCAVYSKCGHHRMVLTREWDSLTKKLVVIGLNPSTATELEDDPTIRRCIGFAKRFNYGGLVMLNLFSFRATDPKAMKAEPNPNTVANDEAIRVFVEEQNVICAWGNHGTHRDRDRRVMAIIESVEGARPFCLGVNKTGTPKHPLYLPGDAEVLKYMGR